MDDHQKWWLTQYDPSHTPFLDCLGASLPPLDMSRRARFRRWRRNVSYVTRQRIAARVFPEGAYDDEC